MRAIARHAVVVGCVIACGAVTEGCGHRPVALGSHVERAPSPLGDIVIPLAVRSFDVTTTDNQHAVFFKLSRVPDGITKREQDSPPRIFIDVAGPATGDDLATDTYPGNDTLVSQIQMSRTAGQLHFELELSAEQLPEYSVHQMADWVLVRLHVPR